jgi:polysaccharide export outer membrane protein
MKSSKGVSSVRVGMAVVLILGVCLASGCGSKGGWERAAPGESPVGLSTGLSTDREYALAVGDQIALEVLFYDDFDATAVIRPDGKVTLPLVGEIEAAGFTPSRLDSLVTARFSEIVVDPNVSIIVKEYSDQLVYVLGEVELPGAYPLQHGMTLVGALSAAKGTTRLARLTDVVLVRRETPLKGWGVKLNVERFFEEADFSADPQLQAYDIVYVPRTKIGSLSVFLELVFRPLAYPLSIIVRGYELVTVEER